MQAVRRGLERRRLAAPAHRDGDDDGRLPSTLPDVTLPSKTRTSSSREVRRQRLTGGGIDRQATLPVPMAGLPGNRAIVSVGPPL